MNTIGAVLGRNHDDWMSLHAHLHSQVRTKDDGATNAEAMETRHTATSTTIALIAIAATEQIKGVLGAPSLTVQGKRGQRAMSDGRI